MSKAGGPKTTMFRGLDGEGTFEGGEPDDSEEIKT